MQITEDRHEPPQQLLAGGEISSGVRVCVYGQNKINILDPTSRLPVCVYIIDFC